MKRKAALVYLALVTLFTVMGLCGALAVWLAWKLLFPY